MKAESLTTSHIPSQNQRAPATPPGPSHFQAVFVGMPQQEGPELSGFPFRQSVTGSSSFFPLRTIEEGKDLREWGMNVPLEELEDQIIFSEYLKDVEGAHILKIVFMERTRM